MSRAFSRIFFLFLFLVVAERLPAVQSTARMWDEKLLSAIRLDTPNPPVHARNLFHISVAMYDAWAAYDSNSVGYIYRGKQVSTNVEADRSQAISYAAYRMLVERFSIAKNSNTSVSNFTALMNTLGYPTNNLSTNPATPAGLGNLIAQTVSAYFINDGSFQTNRYADLPANQGGYFPLNAPLTVSNTFVQVADVNHWQPLAITNGLDQNGNPIGPVQTFLGSQWLHVRPFALSRIDYSKPWINYGPQPKLDGVGNTQFRSEVVDVISRSSLLAANNTNLTNISPGVFGNNSVGMNDGTGHPVNPSTGLPYPSNFVKVSDFARVLSEFWADGPNSETPPGHWNVIANSVADNTNFVKRIGGTGPVVNDLEWDVKTYFALNAAVHDAACAAWSNKRYYDGGRPIEYIRFMGELGQSTLTNDTTYDIDGLTLTNGLIEIVTRFTSAAGQKHFGLPVGSIALYVWPGQPQNTTNPAASAKWIQAVSWLPYQKATFVTPAFPGYFSGHSTFSRAAAEVLTSITGSPWFPGGLGTFTAVSNTFLTFEQGPSQTIQLQWGTYYDAADQAGLSRLWGGIHVSADDLAGRLAGSQCGIGAWALASKYFDGSILSSNINLTIAKTGTNQYRLTYNTMRGFSYKLQNTPDFNSTFSDYFITNQMTETMQTNLYTSATNKGFFRVVRF
jgi:hypothetical protein